MIKLVVEKVVSETLTVNYRITSLILGVNTVIFRTNTVP